MSITREQAIAGSPKDKEKYLEGLRIPHRNQTDITTTIADNLKPGAGLTIILLVGPPGVGKTTIGRMVLRQLLDSFAIQIQEDPSVIPAVMSEVDAPDRGEVNFVLFYSRLCHDLLSPSHLDGIRIINESTEPLDQVRNSRLLFERALWARQVEYLILDEVLHLTNSITDPKQYGNLLKSLSNRAGFNLLLLGAYGCEKLVLASGQLARRIKVVHYPRYYDNRKDFEAYCIAVKSFAEALPVRCKVDVKNCVGYLFQGTFGLLGQTFDILKEATKPCIADGETEWKDEYIRRSMPSIKAQLAIARETVSGESTILPFLQGEALHEYATEDQVRAQLKLEAERAKALRTR
ncbi:ATP-binding protein [Caballeronia sp. J97]|uniref:ATP-binding protein n=1 Tax=Caballeronia sp. J97 TaxID=2805429 RepID=UPI002AB28675|nr:AAA family ATPase [Caballeronia sp. J97]